jgi:hypothetical protein
MKWILKNKQKKNRTIQSRNLRKIEREKVKNKKEETNARHRAVSWTIRLNED